jgi:hypothetical protein
MTPKEKRDTEAELRDAIYWLLRAYRDSCAAPGNETVAWSEVWDWLRYHGYDPASPKAHRLLARKRVPR